MRVEAWEEEGTMDTQEEIGGNSKSVFKGTIQ